MLKKDWSNMTDEFLQKYKELEQLVLAKFFVKEGESAVWALGAVPEFVSLRPHLNAIREIRNFLAHQPMYENQSLIVPTEAAVKIVDSLMQKIKGPNTVYSVCIKPSGILCAKPDDQVSPVVKIMQDKQYHIVPIIERGKVVGVLSDASKVIKDIDAETTFDKIKEHTNLDEHVGRTVLFVAKTDTIEFVKLQIAEYFRQGHRVNAIFVTETGKTTEALIGLLLPLQLV